MKVLIVPEDQTLDQFIVLPVVEGIFAELGRRATLRVLPEPQLHGASEALDREIIAEIITDYQMFDLVLLIVDRDGNRTHHEEKAAEREREHPERLLACLAIEEIEVWLLALHTKKLAVSFKSVREHHDPKEAFAEPLLKRLGDESLGYGRKEAMRAIAGNWKGLCSRCPEIAELRERIAAWLAEHP